MKKYNVYGVGNALVDTIVSVEEDFLKQNNITKGVMTLVDTPTLQSMISKLMDYRMELRSGGSAANTMIALANSGGNGVYTGKVGNDFNGNFYKKDMGNAGILFDTSFSKTGSTGRCLVLITPDADRTMLTDLGVSTSINDSDIDGQNLALSEIVYIEGYLWDKENTKKASVHAMEIAQKNKVKVAFTYSDPFCVERSKEDFIKLTKDYINIVFCNFDEAKHLSGKDKPEEAIKFIGQLCNRVFMTFGSQGAYICQEGNVRLVPGFPTQAIDTTGAGDSFAAGVLYGICNNYSLDKACRWGNYVASKVISVIGARIPQKLNGQQSDILVDYI